MRLVVCLWCGPVVMAGTARLAAGPTCLLLVLVVVNVAETAVKINVMYPQDPNYSVVNLTCTDSFNDALGGTAVFRRNGSGIGEPGVVSNLMEDKQKNSVVFTFNQQQEGNFSCEYDDSEDFVLLAGT